MSSTNFAVPLPAAGANAIIAFEFSDLEKLEKELGAGYVQKVLSGLNGDDTAIIRRCVVIALKGGDASAALENTPLDVLKAAIGDALTRRLTGNPA